MEELKVFKNDEFGVIRTTNINGELYFVGKDVANVLGYSDENKAISMHIDDEDKLNDKTALSLGQRGGWFINESGLYSLIISSKLPTAKKFKRWVTSEVLPSIRKNGGYIANQEQMTPEQIVASALVVAQNIIDKQNKKLQEQEPLVKFAEHVSESTNSISIGDFSKIVADENIRVGRNRMFDWLKNNRYIMKGNNIPYQKYIDNNMFEVIEQVFKTPYGTKTGTKTLITGKGQIHIMEKLRDEFGEV